MTSFLHGSETIEVVQGARPITVVKAAVIGLVGAAPKGPLNTPTLVLSQSDAAQFGDQVPGFSIPQALSAIFAQGAGTVIVVNAFDPDTMCTTVTGEEHTVASGKIATTYPPVKDLVITNKVTEPAVPTTLDEDTDYTVDSYGNVTLIGDAATTYAGEVLVCGYKRLNAAAVTASVIVGAIDGDTGERTGTKCFELCYNLFGFNPKLIIAPGYSTLSAVAAEMTTIAEKYKGFAIKDAPTGTTVSVALAGRGPDGDINFFTSHKRDVLLFPMLKAYDPATDANVVRPYSSFFAGLWAKVINDEGFHVSPSNHQILGITGVELDITASVDDATAETNTLNAAGIVTVFSNFGSGYRTWGNRSAAYPSSTLTRDVFLACQMTASVLDESIRYAMLQFLDKPVDQAWIDSVVESVNGFIRGLIQRGALIDGKCFFDVNSNTVEEMAAGHYTFSYSFASPVPGERITFNSAFDINLLKSLK